MKTACFAITAAFWGGFALMAEANPTLYNQSAYSSVRGWDVSSTMDGSGRFVGCTGNPRTRADTLILSIENGTWTMTVPTARTDRFAGALVQVDATQIDAQFGFDGGYATREISNYELGLLKAGNILTVRINGEPSMSFPLKGSTAAILKIDECNQLRGQAPQQNAAQSQSSSRPSLPTRGPNSVQASCSTVFNGTFSCTVFDEAPDPQYIDAFRVESNSSSDAYFLQVLSDDHADVWFSMGGKWDYMGLWGPEGPGGNCFAPVGPQSPEAEGNLGQDAWQLCVQ